MVTNLFSQTVFNFLIVCSLLCIIVSTSIYFDFEVSTSKKEKGPQVVFMFCMYEYWYVIQYISSKQLRLTSTGCEIAKLLKSCVTFFFH